MSDWRKLFPAAPCGLVRPARSANDFQPDDYIEKRLGEGSAERINLIMKNKIICCLIPFLLLGCSKQPHIIPSALSANASRIVTPETKELDVVRDQVMAFLAAKDYDKLDEFAAKLRSSKERNADGAWKLSEVYYALGVSNNIFGMPIFDNIPDKAFEERLADLQDWIIAKPGSITARVALACVQVDYAWNARGGDYASKVTNEGWRLFGERLIEAEKNLRACEIVAEAEGAFAVRG